MIKINPANAENLAKQVMQESTKGVSFIQKQGEKVLAQSGYKFGNGPESNKIKELAVAKINKAANLPKDCGEIFVTIA